MAREMKDSGIDGVGTIPKEWKIQPLKTISTILRGGSPRPIEEFISKDDTGYNWIRIGDSVKGSKYITTTLRKIIPEGLPKTRLIKKGSLILSNSMSFGQPYILDIDGCIHDGWVAFSEISVNKEYLYYFLLSEMAKIQFQQQVAGGVVLNLNVDKIGTTKIAIPNKKEQTKIVNYLNTECARIDAVIEQTRASIEEYKKLKQAVITQAVTKGIRPNRPMKDSGIEWIGEIPFEWNTISIGRLFSISAGGDAKPEFYSDVQDEEHPYPVYTNSMSKNQVYAYTSKPIFEKGTVTVTGRGAIGTAFYRETPYDAIIRLLSLRPKLDLDGRFYAYWISNVIHFFTDSAAVGQLSAIQMASYKTIYCQKEEQSVIADYLDAECSKIDILISKKELLLSEIELYKKSLIYEYVTGKKEVPA